VTDLSEERNALSEKDRHDGDRQVSDESSRALLSAPQGVTIVVAMLYDFLRANREEILDRARKRIGARSAPKPTELELADALPFFLDQLGDALLLARSRGRVTHDSIPKTASTHRAMVFGKGLTVEHAIHDYGDLCRVVTDLALDRKEPISVEGFVTLSIDASTMPLHAP
jgi:hypothetical protein